MTRMEALERVAEAAQILEGGSGVIRGRTPEDDDIYTHELGHMRELVAALDMLSDALPAAPHPETREVPDTEALPSLDAVAVLYADHGGGLHMALNGSVSEARFMGWRRLGTFRLPIIPE